MEQRHYIITDLKVLDSNKEIDPISSDISKNGLQFVCRKEFPVDSLLFISPVLMSLENPWECRIQWVKPAPNTDLFAAGAKFIKAIPDDDFQSILQICDK